MVINVGINGFGRIGRIVTRACLQNSDIQLTAINDPAVSVEYMCYLIKFDSTHGKMQGIITYTDNEVVVNDHSIKVFHEKLPSSVPWESAGVQYVVEASGMFTSYEKASGHLESVGVRRVIVTAPSVDIPMIILGVNDHHLHPDRTVISCSSSTLYCLAPIVKVLEDSYGVEEGFVTSIHAMTPSLKPLDGLCLRGRHWRDHRSIHQNIIPATTGACKALGKILPSVKDKLSGLAFRVPIVNVSVLDLTIRLQTDTTLEDIVKSIEQASQTTLKNIIRVSSEESVSSDFMGESHSCIFDEDSSIQLKPNFIKIICWYENEYSYACRVVDTITVSNKLINQEIVAKITLRNISLKNEKQQIELGKKDSRCAFSRYGSRITSSISHDTGVKYKSSYHQQNPLFASTPYTQPSNASKKNELLKIWNNSTTENSITRDKENICTFFQPCVFAAQPVKVECNTKKHLESVKKEFSKMVNITENLLKKTFSSQSNSQLPRDDLKKVSSTYFRPKGDIIKKDSEKGNISIKDSETTFTKASEKNSPVEELVEMKNKSSQEDSLFFVSCDTEKSDRSECSSNITRNSLKFLGQLPEKELKKNDMKDKPTWEIFQQDNTDDSCRSNENNEFNKQLSKTINTLMDGMSQNIHVRCVWNKDKIKTVTADNEKTTNATCVDEKPDLCKGDEYVPFDKKNSDSSKSNNFKEMEAKIQQNNDQFKLNKDISNKYLINHELKKRNILLFESFMAETKIDLCSHDSRNSTVATDDTVIKDISTHTSSREVLESRYTTDVSELVSTNTSKCVTPENTMKSISNIVLKSTQDIFDKLDSASATDSNNSFEIDERKSQVIQITDLTNSLEDLAHLDKICRIIEISDELSDKLFSALDSEDGNQCKKKRWSFKDLCTKIKLDEFCNKMFGGNHTSI